MHSSLFGDFSPTNSPLAKSDNSLEDQSIIETKVIYESSSDIASNSANSFCVDEVEDQA